MKSYEAYAFQAHANLRRRYTGAPYTDHLYEVARLVSTTFKWYTLPHVRERMLAVSWLHDTLEDTAVTYWMLQQKFGIAVADGVQWLSDLDFGNRKERKEAARQRLAIAPGWVQTIKVADIISNVNSIKENDPKFAKVYVPESIALLNVLGKADKVLLEQAHELLPYLFD